jgi:hypothetical protein
MTDSRSAWNDAGERLSGLGLKLKLHYEQQRGEESEQARSEVEGAVKRLADAVQDTFEAMGAAAKDQAVREDVKQVGQSLTDALNATFAEVSGEMRKAFSRPAGASSAGASSAGATPAEESRPPDAPQATPPAPGPEEQPPRERPGG